MASFPDSSVLRLMWQMARSARGAAVALFLTAAGCTGVIKEPIDLRPTVEGPPLVRPRCEGVPTAIAVPARRLTRTEYQASLVAMFGPTVADVSARYPGASVTAYPYSTFAEGHLVGEDSVRELLNAAEEVAESLLPVLTMCNSGDFATCASARFAEWIPTAFRRAATPAEIARFADDAVAARNEGFSNAEALAAALVGLLQDPSFLYVIESTPDTSWTLTPAQRAQRISLTLGATVPDDVLSSEETLAALATPDGLSTEVDRWLDSERGRVAFRQFMMEWLGLLEMPDAHDDAVRTSLIAELERLIDDVYDAEDGFALALRGDTAYVDSVLETFYGLPSESSGPGDFRRVTLDGRVGLFTHPLVMAHGAHGGDTSVVLRGKLILLNLLCGHIDPPPANAMSQEPVLPASTTPRARYEARGQNQTCAGCHIYLDPIGFAFEAYDALGRHRTEAYGAPVDDEGEIIGTGVESLDGTFDGVGELADRMLASEEVAFCFARQWTRYAYGVFEHDAGGATSLLCTGDRVGERFVNGGRNVREMLRAYAEDPSFVERTPETME